jgi:hypothetical protein
VTSVTQEIEMTTNNKTGKYLLKDKMFFFLYGMYFILAPFYFWKSGLPQISDFILVLLVLSYAVSNKFNFSFNINNRGFLLFGVLFVSYVFTINLIWILLLQSSSGFLLSSTFYLYNFLVATMVITLYNKYKQIIIRITYYAILISVIIQTVLYFTGGGFTGGRMTVSFNNPNQLGYFALISASILIFTSNKIKVDTKWFFVGIICLFVLVFASLSKAAILSFIGLIFFFLLARTENKKLKRNMIYSVILMVLAVGVIYNTTPIIQENHLINSVQNRIKAIGSDSDDSLQGRGYDRISEYPQFWIFGAGEGQYSRFKNQRIEFHSTLGNIQVSYGIFGSLLFLSLLFIALKKDKYRSWYILVFIMAYGLTHNGIRNSMLWILLALMASYQIKEKPLNE